jgi:hypothetical protein
VSDHVFSSLFYSTPILAPLSHVKHHRQICFNSVISLATIPLSDFNSVISLAAILLSDL